MQHCSLEYTGNSVPWKKLGTLFLGRYWEQFYLEKLGTLFLGRYWEHCSLEDTGKSVPWKILGTVLCYTSATYSVGTLSRGVFAS